MSMSTWGMASAPKTPVQWRVLRLDPADGRIEWSRTIVEAVPKFAKHASNSYATETPCAAGDAVVAFFGATGTLVALDHDGGERWRREFGPQPIQNQFGTGSSPVFHPDAGGGRILLQLYNEDSARLHCLDPRTGADLWTADRGKGTAWSTPVVWTNDGTPEVVTAGEGSVIAYSIADGAERWRLGGLDTSFACSLGADADGIYYGTSSCRRSRPPAASGWNTGDDPVPNWFWIGCGPNSRRQRSPPSRSSATSVPVAPKNATTASPAAQGVSVA